MNIALQLYQNSISGLPQSGQHVLAQQTADQIVVYQAYRPAIASFAIKNQTLGGADYSMNRMSWIKPGFLWMMYRCGWASKQDQERVLAIWINKYDFEEVLRQAVFSSYNENHYVTHEQWKAELDAKEVRLQWDPDHDPYGDKLTRRAIQLGLKGNALRQFIKQISRIDDVTEFVKEQKDLLDTGNFAQLQIPVETIFRSTDEALNKRIGID